MIDDSYYVLPSSTHELMIVPCKSGISPEHLGKTVREVNEIMGSETEVLSDRIMQVMTEYERAQGRKGR